MQVAGRQRKSPAKPVVHPQPALTHPISPLHRSRDVKLQDHVTPKRAAAALVLFAAVVAVAVTPQLGGATVSRAVAALDGVSPNRLAHARVFLAAASG